MTHSTYRNLDNGCYEQITDTCLAKADQFDMHGYIIRGPQLWV